jgi:hypothetical protein
VVVARAATPVLRLLEGYWPQWADPLRRPLADRQWRRATSLQQSWDELRARVDDGTADTRQRAEYSRVERRLRDYPEDKQRSLPTLLGNVLRAAETRPVDRYGLDPVRTWAPLWLVLPDTARSELTGARSALDGSVRMLIWSVLLLVWSPFTWWAVAVAVALATHQLMVALPARARSYGAVLDAAIDVHRNNLYDALRWPLPETPAEERAVGEAVTEYLWRGSDDDEPTFRTS